jgi:transposase
MKQIEQPKVAFIYEHAKTIHRMETLFITYRFRIKGASARRRLNKFAILVNQVWNYCNATSFHAIRDHSKWLSQVSLDGLLAGTSQLLGLHSQTVQAISKEYVTRRVQFRKRKLRWRVSHGSRRSLGWIPFKASGIRIDGNEAIYFKQRFRFWNSWEGSKPNQRKFEGKIKSGSFSQDAKGDWYLNLTCEVGTLETAHEVEEVGIDLGLKDTAILSDGTRIENRRFLRKLEEKLARSQKFHKKRRVRAIHRKIANRRKDYFHKETTKIAKKYQDIFVGNVSGKFLQKTHGKSSTDASTGFVRDLLEYKAIRHQGRFYEVSEFSSTITCSSCLKKTGPSGLSGLDVRGWTCSECRSEHDRDINAAKNILRFGRESLKQPVRAA